MGREEVRLADEVGDEQRRRIGIYLLGMAHLHQLAQVEHPQAVGDRHRLFLIMGDVDRHDSEFFLDAPDFLAHVDPKLGVQIGQRLVQQQHAWVVNQGAGNRNTLLLAPRKVRRIATRQVIQTQEI